MRERTADRQHDRARPTVLTGWGALWLAIALNVSQVFLLVDSEGLRRPALLPLAAAGFLAELVLFARAVRCLAPVIAYAAYGATPAIVTALSVAFTGEAVTVAKVAAIAAITGGIALLATDGSASPDAEGTGQAAAHRERKAHDDLRTAGLRGC
jgi:small multidrug resistance pump